MDKVALKESQIDRAALALQGGPSTTKKLTNADKANAHHGSDVKNWKYFEDSLQNKGFQRAILKHDLSDDKLKDYVKNYGAYLTSKKTVATVPSRTSPTKYELRLLPSGRVGCGCKDWQYKHSWKGTDCDHIQDHLSKSKTSGASTYLTRLAIGTRAINRKNTNKEQGELAQAYVRALKRLKQPQEPAW